MNIENMERKISAGSSLPHLLGKGFAHFQNFYDVFKDFNKKSEGLRLIRLLPGILGRYYAARHSYGYYRSCAVSGVYYVPHTHANNDLSSLLRLAVAETITEHPPLCYGVIERDGDDEAHLYRLATIDLDDVIEVHLPVPEEGDGELCEQIGIGHQHLWTQQHERPAWKIVVLRYNEGPESTESRIDILFFTHHAISDGTGCAAFHKTLLSELQKGCGNNQDPVTFERFYTVPKDIPTPVFIEDVFPLEKQVALPRAQHNVDSKIDPWTSVPPFLESIESFRSRALTLNVPCSQMSFVLSYCRRQHITFTGLLHALITSYLSRALPSAQSFRSSTPISMRRFTATSNDELVNHVSFLVHDWSPAVVSAFRESQEKPREEETALLSIATQFQDQVKKEILGIPENGPEGLLWMAGIRDLDAFCQETVKAEKRDSTYEISNLGCVTCSKGESSHQMVRMDRLVFSQCGMVAGPAFGCSVASVSGGPLCVCLHWQEGAVDVDLITGLKNFLQSRLMSFERDATAQSALSWTAVYQ